MTDSEIQQLVESTDYSQFDPILAPSIMCADPWDIKTYLDEFKKVDLPLIHYDVMDGQFVPNIMLGTENYAAIHRASDIPLDLHLMTLRPQHTIEYFDVKPGDYVSFHPETCTATYSLLSTIKSKGCKAGIALCPATPIDVIYEVTEVLDFVLMMAVEPGFAGQKMLPNHLDKASRIVKLRQDNNLDFTIMVDGNANVENIKKNLAVGVDNFVTGSSMLGPKFKAENFAQDYADFRAQIGLAK